MNELLMNRGERKLWYDGPNYAADAVILDLEADKVLLIERTDTGEWALPGGFIDPTGESSLEAALREAEEEAGVTGLQGGQLCYRGKTSDRRSTATAWIETSAHLFHLASSTQLLAGDDAKAATWHGLGDLPPLYGAHQMILERALDYSDSETLLDIVDAPDAHLPVEGGYMQYDKWIAAKDNEQAFVKACPKEHPGYGELLSYLEKEAGVMSHLRRSGFSQLPEKSLIRDGALVMDALPPEDGWHWHINQDRFDTYLEDTLRAFAELETIPPQPDSFDVEPSYESVLEEGWQAFDASTLGLLEERYHGFKPHFTPKTQEIAERLLADIPTLKNLAETAPEPDEFVFCHHDIRQENLAWHPEKGVKIIDWSWAGPGLPGSDGTSLLIDLHKNGYDIDDYKDHINPQHCLNLMGFWLHHSILPDSRASGLRAQQFRSAVSAYELLTKAPRGEY